MIVHKRECQRGMEVKMLKEERNLSPIMVWNEKRWRGMNYNGNNCCNYSSKFAVTDLVEKDHQKKSKEGLNMKTILLWISEKKEENEIKEKVKEQQQQQLQQLLT